MQRQGYQCITSVGRLSVRFCSNDCRCPSRPRRSVLPPPHAATLASAAGPERVSRAVPGGDGSDALGGSWRVPPAAPAPSDPALSYSDPQCYMILFNTSIKHVLVPLYGRSYYISMTTTPQVVALGGQRSVRRQCSVGEGVASCPRLRSTTGDMQRLTMSGDQRPGPTSQ